MVRLGPTALNNGACWDVGQGLGNLRVGLIAHVAASITMGMGMYEVLMHI